MRKRIIRPGQEMGSEPEGYWLNLEEVAEAEITSEDPEHPIENALIPGSSSGWRAAQPGDQTIRILFNQPQKLHRIWIHFLEPDRDRTQQFVLRWSPDRGKTFQQIVRQQWNFSPHGNHEEIENIYVDLPAVTLLELAITPDLGSQEVYASLQELRLG
ncbi:MAG: hypothetical protein RI601_04805 [Desulfurivibrionaceae bacterium]|nr:hypothetical protein [Desulfurivibrionaceae bacterium]